MENPNFKFSNKLLIILSIFIILVIGIYFSSPYISHYLPFLKNVGIKSQIQPKLVKQTNLESLYSNNLYYIGLIYNPQTRQVTQKESSKVQNEPSAMFSKPSNNKDDFNYYVEIYSPSEEVVKKGWISRAKELMTTPDGELKINLILEYNPGFIIKLYSDSNQLIWNGTIK